MAPRLTLITAPTPNLASTAEFVEAMSALASGVVLVTCWVGDRPWGMTVTAFASASANPPTVLVALSSEASQRSRDHRRATCSGSVSSQRNNSSSPATARHRARASSSTRSSSPAAGGAQPRSSPAHSPTSTAGWPTRPRSRTTPSSSVTFGPQRLERRGPASLPPPHVPNARRARFNGKERRKERQMTLELTARTEPGERLVALAETLADEIAPRAAAHDREGSFPFDSFAAVKQSGYLTAPIPEELGGLGVTSVHDVLVAASRLARGDAALTLGINMHLLFVLSIVRRRQIALAAATSDAPGRSPPRSNGSRPAARSSRPQAASPGRTSPDRRRLRPARREAGSSPAARCSAPCRPSRTSSTRPSRTPTTTAVSCTAMPDPPRNPGRRRPQRLGRARHARFGQPLRLLRERGAPAVDPPRRLPSR